MKKRKLHITILSLLIWSFCFSQQYTNYSTKDGLPSNHIYKVIQDAKGFIWMATDKGLVKYNGSEFKTFTTRDGLATNDVWGLNVTPDGKLWFQSKAPKIGYIENDSVYAFFSETKGEIFNSVFTGQIDNEIILANSSRFHKLVDGKWQTIIKNKNRVSNYDSYLQHKNLIRYVTNERLDTLSFIDIHESVVKRIYIYDVLGKRHKRGQLTDSLMHWVSNDRYKILNLNTLKLTERTLKEEINIEKSQYTRINIVNNQLQISGKGFVGILDQQFHIKKVYYFPEHINAHFGLIDNAQNIWLCSFTNGLYKLPKVKRDIRYRLKNHKEDHLTQVKDKIIASVYNKGYFIYEKNNKDFSMFLNNPEFLYRPNYVKTIDKEYYNSETKTISVKNEKRREESFRIKVNSRVEHNSLIQQLVDYNGFVYSRYSFGINKINPKTNYIVKEYPQAGVNSISVFNNKLLIATTNGLKQLNGDKIEAITFQNQQLDKSVLNTHNISKTEVLLNTDGFGAYITDLKTIIQLKGSEFLIVNNAFINDDIIWLATNKGLLEYKKEKGHYILKRQLDKNNGLPSNNVTDVIINENDILVSTNFGVAIIPKNKIETSQLLDIYIEDATYNKNRILEVNSTFKYKDNNTLNFKVSTINFSENNSSLTYKYQLKPLQKEWVSTTSRLLSFNDLSPNNYTLKVKADDLEAAINFKIKPLWWQKQWSRFLGLIVSVLSIYYIARFFVKRSQNKKNQKILEDKRLSELQLEALRSQMNPHFVFNSLAAIQYYINNDKTETSEAYLVKFSKLIRQFFELSKETEITLTKEIKLLINYLEIEKLRFKEKLNFKVVTDPKLNTEKRTIPSMLLQPIVENAVNHGVFNKMDNGLITLNFSHIKADTFKVEIIDDGVGFVNTKKRKTKKVKSSNVLEDRLHFLNQTKRWNITYNTEEFYPNNTDKVNISKFTIQELY